MKREDERILEYLSKEGLSTPRLIAREAFKRVSKGHVRERLEILRYAGLVAKTGLSSYEMSEAGERYLDGNLDASHQPSPSVNRVL